MSVKRIAILYICTGRYEIFWRDFYESSVEFFLSSSEYEKHYFVFTDSKGLKSLPSKNINIINIDHLSWPYITLYRFKFFSSIYKKLENFDFIYFFNANMKFTKPITKEILPIETEYDLALVLHPGYFNLQSNLPFEGNPDSTAYINPSKEHRYYFMGGLNGGKAKPYLHMIEELKLRIEQDEVNSIIARWHDESHLNKYASEKMDKIKILSPTKYAVPEGQLLEAEGAIVIRNKANYGGHNFMRKTGKVSFTELMIFLFYKSSRLCKGFIRTIIK